MSLESRINALPERLKQFEENYDPITERTPKESKDELTSEIRSIKSDEQYGKLDASYKERLGILSVAFMQFSSYTKSNIYILESLVNSLKKLGVEDLSVKDDKLTPERALRHFGRLIGIEKNKDFVKLDEKTKQIFNKAKADFIKFVDNNKLKGFEQVKILAPSSSSSAGLSSPATPRTPTSQSLISSIFNVIKSPFVSSAPSSSSALVTSSSAFSTSSSSSITTLSSPAALKTPIIRSSTRSSLSSLVTSPLASSTSSSTAALSSPAAPKTPIIRSSTRSSLASLVTSPLASSTSSSSTDVLSSSTAPKTPRRELASALPELVTSPSDSTISSSSSAIMLSSSTAPRTPTRELPRTLFPDLTSPSDSSTSFSSGVMLSSSIAPETPRGDLASALRPELLTSPLVFSTYSSVATPPAKSKKSSYSHLLVENSSASSTSSSSSAVSGSSNLPATPAKTESKCKRSRLLQTPAPLTTSSSEKQDRLSACSRRVSACAKMSFSALSSVLGFTLKNGWSLTKKTVELVRKVGFKWSGYTVAVAVSGIFYGYWALPVGAAIAVNEIYLRKEIAVSKEKATEHTLTLSEEKIAEDFSSFLSVKKPDEADGFMNDETQKTYLEELCKFFNIKLEDFLALWQNSASGEASTLLNDSKEEAFVNVPEVLRFKVRKEKFLELIKDEETKKLFEKTLNYKI